MKMIRRAAILAACALSFAACGTGEDNSLRDENGNIVEAGELNVFSLAVGDCFDNLPAGSTVNAVPCAQEHLYEIYHVFDVGFAEFDESAVDDAASAGCVAAFQGYMGVSADTSYYTYDGLQPSAGSWAADDREIICLATPRNGTGTAGTARGAGLVAEQAIVAPTTTAAPTTTTAAPAEETTTTTAPAVEDTTPTTASSGSQSVFELSVGECYVDLAGDQVQSIEPVSCNEPHGIEIVAVFDVLFAEYDADEISQAGQDGCLAAFEPYMGAEYEVSWYALDWLQPSVGSWAGGDREIVCVVFPYEDGITQSVGSAQGTGRLLN